ncbi:hypothetical protein GOP47_0031138 [Adiantum capillus-veneris]|nr:hypothetical protein GOP47_0031138 [Adiantum capillus-veneris]
MRWTGNRKPRATTERSQLTSFHLPKRTRIDNAAKSKFEQQENEDGDQFTIIDLVENDCQIFDKMKTTIDAFKDLYDKTIASRRFQHSKRVASNR